MKWIKIKDRLPEYDDLPFLTAEKINTWYSYVLWDDDDWFNELDDKERYEYDYWVPINKPSKDNT